MTNKNGYTISVSIPSSSLIQENSLLEKSLKISWFARSASIFGIKNILIYEDKKEHISKKDINILKILLEYLNVPQYLRKHLFSIREELKYVGILPPLRTPHHVKKIDLKKISVGDIRIGMISRIDNNQVYLDLGLTRDIPLKITRDQRSRSYKTGEILNVKFISKYPDLHVKEIPENEIREYWGYNLKFISDLPTFLMKNKNDSLILITKKKGDYFKDRKKELATKLRDIKNIILFFGSPFRDLDEIFPSVDWTYTPNIYFLNMFPNQHTETIRLEEAVFGSLSVFNEFLNEFDY